MLGKYEICCAANGTTLKPTKKSTSKFTAKRAGLFLSEPSSRLYVPVANAINACFRLRHL